MFSFSLGRDLGNCLLGNAGFLQTLEILVHGPNVFYNEKRIREIGSKGWYARFGSFLLPKSSCGKSFIPRQQCLGWDLGNIMGNQHVDPINRLIM